MSGEDRSARGRETSGHPDFFLGSTEHRGDWARPRAAYVLRVAKDGQGTPHLWIRVDPPAIVANLEVEELIVGPHFEHASIWPHPRFPVPVNIYIPKPGLPHREVFDQGDFVLAAWGEIHERRTDVP